MTPHSAAPSQSIEQTLHRRLRDLREIASRLKDSRMTPLQLSHAIVEHKLADTQTREFFGDLPEDEKHYWIASLYALLMPTGRRRRLAAYFTPPYLAQHAIDVLIEAGIDPCSHRILDPASGGATFLVPLATRIARDLRRRGQDSRSVLQIIEAKLAGIEIEPRLARLSHILLADVLQREITEADRGLSVPVQRTNTLKLQAPDHLFDAIIGNPPYGRVFRPSKELLARFAPVITDGYVNLYALFIEQALRWVRPGGVICLIVPMSFVGGPYFTALRKRILEAAHVLRVDPIYKRSDVFLDVLYDVCVLGLRKRNGPKSVSPATSSLLLIDELPRLLGRLDLPSPPSERVWGLPDGAQDDQLFRDGLETLGDYGYITKTGYFVWNREQHRHRTGTKLRPTEVPLYWAHNVKPNIICEPLEGPSDSKRISFVTIAKDSTAIVRTDAIILQRTSNRQQKRRLIAGLILKGKVHGSRGFVSENHTILIIPDLGRPQGVPLKMLCRLLNTAPVDARFRRISGSVNVSTKALRQLPLPAASAVHAAFVPGILDDEAAETAYTASLQRDDGRLPTEIVTTDAGYGG